jgi:hypothetical protein
VISELIVLTQIIGAHLNVVMHGRDGLIVLGRQSLLQGVEGRGKVGLGSLLLLERCLLLLLLLVLVHAVDAHDEGDGDNEGAP